MQNEQMRAEFEAWAKEHFICTPHSFARTANGLYYNTVASRDAPVVYAAVSMLWAAWRESRRQQGSAAQAVAVLRDLIADMEARAKARGDVDDDGTVILDAGSSVIRRVDEILAAPPVADAEGVNAALCARCHGEGVIHSEFNEWGDAPCTKCKGAGLVTALSRKAKQPAEAQDLPPSVERSVQYIMDAVAHYANHKDENTLARIRSMVTGLELIAADRASRAAEAQAADERGEKGCA